MASKSTENYFIDNKSFSLYDVMRENLFYGKKIRVYI